MSAFVLNKKYELALPTSYVDVDNEEMEYVDGGTTYSGAKGWAAAVAIAGVGAGTAYFAGKLTAMLISFGPIGWLTAAIACAPITYICGQLAGAGKQALWKMATNGKFTITCTKNPTALFNVK